MKFFKDTNHKTFAVVSYNMLNTSLRNGKVTYLQIMGRRKPKVSAPISRSADGKKMTNIFNLELSQIFLFMYHLNEKILISFHSFLLVF